MYSEHFAFDQEQQPGLTRAGSLHNSRQSNAMPASFRPRSVSAGNKATPSQQPTSPYLQRISSRSSPLLSASGKKSDMAMDKKTALQQVNLTGSRYKTELCRAISRKWNMQVW